MDNNQQDVPQTPAQPNRPVAETEDPGKTLALVGIVVSVLGFAMIGTGVSIYAYIQSKQAGLTNKLAIAGIVVGTVLFIIGTVISIYLLYLFMNFSSPMIEECKKLGPGTHVVGNSTYECGNVKTEFNVRV